MGPCLRRRVASPIAFCSGAAGQIDHRLLRLYDRAARNEILMCGKAVAALSREHVLGQRILLGELPVGLNLRRIGILVGVVTFRRTGATVELNGIERVPLAAVLRYRVA